MNRLTVILLIILSCCSENDITHHSEQISGLIDIETSQADLPKIERLILREYYASDSVFFDSVRNESFKEAIREELFNYPLEFDALYHGMLIKYFFLRLQGLSFCLIKDSKGAYYYIGMADLHYFFHGIKGRYVSKGTQSTYQNSSISEITDIWGTSTQINKVIRNAPLFNEVPETVPPESIDSYRMSLAAGLIHKLYQRVDDSYGFPWVSFFDEVVDVRELESYFLSLKPNDEKLNKSEVSMLEKFKKLQYFFIDKKAIIFQLKEVGLVVFIVSSDGDSISVSETFLPQLVRLENW